MAENSEISWTDNTFNPLMGCTKVSPACANCYAERDMDHRYGKVAWGPHGTRVVTTDANWRKPIKWNKDATDCGQWCKAAKTDGVCCPNDSCDIEDNIRSAYRPRVFCASLADVFEDWKGPIHDHQGYQLCLHPSEPDRFVPIIPGHQELTDEQRQAGWREVTYDDVRARLFRLIDKTPNLDWLLLTKRPENIRRMWTPFDWQTPDDVPYRSNVWLGTSVENQEYADKRIPELLHCRGLSPVLFLSCEPLLGPVDLSNLDAGSGRHPYTGILESHQVDWVIAGGESGPGARPTDPRWFESLRDQCQSAGVPFHFKQWGEWLPAYERTMLFHNCPTKTLNGVEMIRVGKKEAGRVLDGKTHDEFPIVKTSMT